MTQEQTGSNNPRPSPPRYSTMGWILLIICLGFGCESSSETPSPDAQAAMDAGPMSDAQTGEDMSSTSDAQTATDGSPIPDAQTTADGAPMPDAQTATDMSVTPDAQGPDNSCGHRVDADMVNFGFNVVLNENGATQRPQGRPLQEGWTLGVSDTEIDDHNRREYARIASYMMPIRDALMCDIATLDRADWLAMTQILTLNNIKTEQNLAGRPPERFYSSEGIYDLLKTGANHHPMMKYLEEAELELKCLAFRDFDFTNPVGDDHCALHDLPVGQGLVLP